jgi:hypothetical protein
MRRADRGGQGGLVVVHTGWEMETEPPNWTPLERRLRALCAEFMWMYRELQARRGTRVC